MAIGRHIFGTEIEIYFRVFPRNTTMLLSMWQFLFKDLKDRQTLITLLAWTEIFEPFLRLSNALTQFYSAESGTKIKT